MTKVIDISKHQGEMDFKKTAQKGVKAVMMRASYGESRDVKFDDFYENATKVGLSVGAYFFATWHYNSVSPDFETAKKNAVSQTKKALSYLSGKKITAPVAVDIELEKGAQLEFSKSELTALVNLAVNEIKKAGYNPVVYSSVSWFNDRFDAEEIACPLWVAYYYNNAQIDEFPDTKYGIILKSLKDKTVLWQYSSKGDGKSYGATSQFIDENFCYDEKLFFNEKSPAPTVTATTDKKSLYTVKIRQGSWYVRKRADVTSAPVKIISGNVTLQASQKKNGWHYLTLHKGWIGPASISKSVYNKNTTPKTHTVKSGENLTIISKKYNLTINEILAKNIKKYPKITADFIVTGWVLNL